MKILTTLAAATLLSSLAMAEGDPAKTEELTSPSAHATFDSLDRDSDQRLSKAEASVDDGFSSQFAKLDTDADGFVNKGEYLRAAQNMPPPPTDTLPAPDPE
jgi:hypothetical protein